MEPRFEGLAQVRVTSFAGPAQRRQDTMHHAVEASTRSAGGCQRRRSILRRPVAGLSERSRQVTYLGGELLVTEVKRV
jgi:hypothetical protein